tara:strand:+ start:147 stop:623 length:477 start_codon:yes stop_codon:yes gene_type:complete
MLKNDELKVLDELRKDSRLSIRSLSKITNIPPTTVSRYVNNLVKSGIIKRYSVQIDHAKIGIGVRAFVVLNADIDFYKNNPGNEYDIIRDLIKHPYIEECNSLTGRFDFILNVRTPNIKELDVLVKHLREVPGIARTESFIVMEENEDYISKLSEEKK